MRHSHKEWIAAIFAVLGAALSGYGATTLFAKVADGEYAPSVGIAVFLASVYLMLRGVDAITQDRLATEKEAYFRTLPFLQANSWGGPAHGTECYDRISDATLDLDRGELLMEAFASGKPIELAVTGFNEFEIIKLENAGLAHNGRMSPDQLSDWFKAAETRQTIKNLKALE
jgi:hypothetical protein